MKTLLIFTAFISLLVIAEGFNLNKAARNSGYSINHLKNVDPNELEEEMYLGSSLQAKSSPWYLRLGEEEFRPLGRGGDIAMVGRVNLIWR